MGSPLSVVEGRRTGRRRRNWTKHSQYRVGRYSRCLHSRNEVEEEKGENKGKIGDRKERRATACTLLRAAYTHIFEQQDSLKLERLETRLRKEYALQMSGLDKKNSRDSSRTSEATSSAMATPLISNVEGHYPRMGMLMPLPQPGTSGAPHFTGKMFPSFSRPGRISVRTTGSARQTSLKSSRGTALD